MPTVSIVVPNYNHAAFLPERLDSIFKQTYQDFEVILLDDCSTDGSDSILSQYSSHPKVSHVAINAENSGSPFRQWKKGVALASGKYVWLAESDDFSDSLFLETLVPVLDSAPAVGVAYCQSQVVDEKSEILFNNKRWTDSLDDKLWDQAFQLEGASAVRKYFASKCVIPNASAVLFRREIFLDLSPALERFRYSGDWQAWVEMLLVSDLYFTPAPLNFFRTHDAVTRKRRTYQQRIEYFMEAYSIIEFIENRLELTVTERENAYGLLARKVLRKFGLKYLLSWRGLSLSKRISRFDPEFRGRILGLFFERLKSKMRLFL